MAEKIQVIKEMIAEGYFLEESRIEEFAATYSLEILKMFKASFEQYKGEA